MGMESARASGDMSDREGQAQFPPGLRKPLSGQRYVGVYRHALEKDPALWHLRELWCEYSLNVSLKIYVLHV